MYQSVQKGSSIECKEMKHNGWYKSPAVILSSSVMLRTNILDASFCPVEKAQFKVHTHTFYSFQAYFSFEHTTKMK